MHLKKYHLCLILFLISVKAFAAHEKIYTKVNLDKKTYVVRTELSYYSDKTLEELRASFDPQSWDNCSKMFHQTFLVDPVTKVPLANPPTAGSDWEGLLYEDFRPVKGKVFEVRNYLAFKSISFPEGRNANERDVLVHEFQYRIGNPIENVFFGITKSGGTLLDDGHIRIFESDHGGYRVEGLKDLKLKLGYLPVKMSNKLSVPMMGHFLPKLAEELLECEL